MISPLDPAYAFLYILCTLLIAIGAFTLQHYVGIALNYLTRGRMPILVFMVRVVIVIVSIGAGLVYPFAI